MNILPYSQDYQLEKTNFKVSEKATELIKKFHQSADGLTLKNWKALSEILDYAAAAEQTIAEQKQYISNLESLAATDMLTGLLNRAGFENEIVHAIARAKRYGEQSLFAFIDLDRFKPINDTHGHNAGDAMLRQVAVILHELHTSASLGFAIINESSTLEQVFEVADKAMYKNKRERQKSRNKYRIS